MKIYKSKWYIQRLTTLAVLAWAGEFAKEEDARLAMWAKIPAHRGEGAHRFPVSVQKPEFESCTPIKGTVLQRRHGDKLTIETVKPEIKSNDHQNQ